MNEIQLLQRAGVAIAIGLLIGIERGWQEREAKDGSRAAGIRTFTLIGALGGLCGLLSSLTAPSLLGYCFLGFAFPFSIFELRKARLAQSVSATTLVAGLLTFVLSAYAVLGNMAVAAAAAVMVAVVLAERILLHNFLERLTWKELRAALLLLVMTAVLLPALPDRMVDPWQALNPYQIWLMTVLIAVVSYGGYIATRLAGERRGLLYAGAVGGLITSTTVTWTFARLARQNPQARPEVMTAILAAWIISLIRMTAIAIFIAPVLAAPLLPPIATAIAVLLIPAMIFYVAAGRAKAHSLFLKDPFELSIVLRFTVLLTAVILAAKLADNLFGQSGLLGLGAFSGLLDVDPITLSIAKSTHAGSDLQAAALVILVAAVANAVAKSVLAFIFGGGRMGGALFVLMVIATAAGAFVFMR